MPHARPKPGTTQNTNKTFSHTLILRKDIITMVRHYIPTGKPRGRPKKIQPQPDNIIITPEIIPHECKPQVISPQQQATSVQGKQDDKSMDSVLKLAIEERGKVLREVISGICTSESSRAHADKLAIFLELVADGGFQGDSCIQAGMTWPDVSRLCAHHPAVTELRKRAIESGQRMRHEKTEQSAYMRAVTGTDRPVYQAGQCVGYIREWSNDLTKLFLQAGDPARFGPPGGSAASVTVNNQTAVVVHWHRERAGG
jgi:hypothetical protein